MGVEEITVRRWCDGFYEKKGVIHYYWPDRRKVEPVEGTGARNKPFKYRLNDFGEFEKYKLGFAAKGWK